MSEFERKAYIDMIRVMIKMGSKLERSLLWVIHEQCIYDGKAYARLLIHGKEAFEALCLPDRCSVEEIENRLFKMEEKHD